MQIETYAEYQTEAAKTASYCSSEYPHLLLGEEIGEVAVAFTELTRQFTIINSNRPDCLFEDTMALRAGAEIDADTSSKYAMAHLNVVKELGDVEWAIAQYFAELGYPQYTNDDATTSIELDAMPTHYLNICGILAKATRKYGQTSDDAIYNAKLEVRDAIVAELDAIRNVIMGLTTVLGIDIHEVYKINTLKLRDRQSRNVIDGVGDNR